jgi:hypothetical protein
MTVNKTFDRHAVYKEKCTEWLSWLHDHLGVSTSEYSLAGDSAIFDNYAWNNILHEMEQDMGVTDPDHSICLVRRIDGPGYRMWCARKFKTSVDANGNPKPNSRTLFHEVCVTIEDAVFAVQFKLMNL